VIARFHDVLQELLSIAMPLFAYQQYSRRNVLNEVQEVLVARFQVFLEQSLSIAMPLFAYQQQALGKVM
jgi:hypothetical protein